MSFSTHTVLAEENATAHDRAVAGALMQRPPFRLSDIWEAPLHDFPIRDEILYQYLPLSTDMDVLEIGPGSGFTAFRLARQVRSLTLVDVAAKSLAEVRQQLRPLTNVRCVCADVTRAGLTAELKQSFDAAFALDVFEYLVDPATCLRNLAEVLRPSGELFLSFPNVPPPQGDGVTYFSHLGQLEVLLDRAVFRRWQIFTVRLRRVAAVTHRLMHEWPLELFHRLRKDSCDDRPQKYEDTWAFRRLLPLKRCKWLIHLYWTLSERMIHLNGEVFEFEPATEDILGRQLVIRAWR